jgi:hypothetical protein
MAMFICANMFLTAAGRIRFGFGTAPASRYTTAALLMTASRLAFLWLNETRPGRRRWVVSGFAFALVIIASGQHFVFHSAHQDLYAKSVAEQAGHTQVYDAT